MGHPTSSASWLGFLALAAASPPARGQESDADRLLKLEQRVATQQTELDALKKQQEQEKGSSLFSTSTDGLRLKSGDGKLDLHIGGRFQEHYRYTDDRPSSTRTTPDTFYVRAARLQIDGTYYDHFGFMVQGDFASSSTGPAPTLQAAYVEWKQYPAFRVMAGQFKAPMSQERLTSRLFSDFVEDSILTRFVPGYDIGMQVQGKLSEGRLNYQTAITNGRSHLDNQGRLRNDDNDAKEGIARLTYGPWAANKESPLRNLRFGASGSLTRVRDVPISGAGVTTFDISTPELGVLLLDPSAGFLDGRRTRVGAELSYATGPLGLRGEYLLRKDEMVNGGLEATVPTTAWYGTATWLLTGEEKVVEQRVVPRRALGSDGGWGAFELAFRVAGARVGKEIEDVGVNLAGNATGLRSYTFGVNWWLQRNLRISADVVQENYDDEIDFGGGRTDDSLWGCLLRFQIDF